MDLSLPDRVRCLLTQEPAELLPDLDDEDGDDDDDADDHDDDEDDDDDDDDEDDEDDKDDDDLGGAPTAPFLHLGDSYRLSCEGDAVGNDTFVEVSPPALSPPADARRGGGAG